MLLTITTTHTPATDLGYLLHKNPARVQSVDLSAGQAHIFYPEASPERCTVALLLDIDPVGLVRNARSPSGDNFALEHYVNDRPYVASSFLAVALSKAFATAMNGTCKDRPGLVDTPLPFMVTLSVLPARGGEALLRRLFEPLGYSVTAQGYPLDEQFPDWGPSRYFTVTLSHRLRLRDLLAHLYVLIPVLDNDKHYWIGEHEVEKLLAKGEGWLQAHPEWEQITRRYLKNLGALTRRAFSLLDADDPEAEEPDEVPTEVAARRQSLHLLRLESAFEQLKASGATRVLDLGCGEGKLLRLLLREKQFQTILGMDVSPRTLEIARDKLHLDRLPEREQQRITLIQGSVVYRDKRLQGYDAAAVVEVIEHLDPARLEAFGGVVFGHARPGTVVVTTPNAEYNRLYESLSAGAFRHADHRFEWTRAEFEAWGGQIAGTYGYSVRFHPVGPESPDAGAPSQMAVFEKGKPETGGREIGGG
jgi:3' terminal RNA ribose 2'-O-methyltransferase Hen1